MIKEERHTIIFSKDTYRTLVAISNHMIRTAPGEFKVIMDKVHDACLFLEGFGFSGNFHVVDGNKVCCYSILPLDVDTVSVIERDSNSVVPTVTLPPSMSFCLYAGLRYILGDHRQLMQSDKTLIWSDISDTIKWDNHKIFSVCYTKSEMDVTSGVLIFEEDPKVCLKLLGSYGGFDDELVNKEGGKLDAPEEVKQKLRAVYSRDTLERQIKEIVGDKEGD